MKEIQSCYWPNFLALERIIRQVARIASLTVVISIITFMTTSHARNFTTVEFRFQQLVHSIL